MSTPEDDHKVDPRITLGLNLTKSCKYVYENQGLSQVDLIFVLHGIMGQVLSWETKDEDEVDDDREFLIDLPPFDPPAGWDPKKDKDDD